MSTERRLRFDDDGSAVVLWKNETITCTCLTHAPDRVEIRLVVVGVLIHREFFSDPEAASQFALDKMRAYNANA